jgi:hypothetical protein
MIRRRRRNREIPFSFDSFLDVVANVVGIIIRLILVVWVGARSYSNIHNLARPAKQSAATAAAVAEPSDPLEAELARQRQELEQAQARLLEQLRRLQQTREGQSQVGTKLAALREQRQSLEQQRSVLERSAAEGGKAVQRASLSLAELRQRQQQLLEEIQALEKLPPVKHNLRYRTPVSRPVHTEEVLFECQGGRVAFIDIAALLDEVRQGMRDKEPVLRTSWQVSDKAGPVGAFRLRYTIARERGPLDSLFSAGSPDANAHFGYGLSEWTVEPVTPIRGETVPAALAEGSEFRKAVDFLDPEKTVVTFFVYPDSFALFRQLRDYLYDRGLMVAGRPQPIGQAITASRRGSLSRGQ